MSQMPQKPNRSNRRLSFSFLLRALFTILVVFLVFVVLYALRVGVGSPASTVGVVLQNPSTEAPQPTESSPETEPANVTEDTEAPTEDPSLEAARYLLENMTLEEKVSQLFVVSPDTLNNVTGTYSVNQTITANLEAYPVGGVIFYEPCIYTPQQVSDLISEMQSLVSIPMFIGVDGEGGYDSGLSKFGITNSYDMMYAYGEGGDTALVEEIGSEIGASLTEVGFNLDFAPVADVLVDPDNTEVGRRSFGSSPETVSSMVQAMVRGLHSGHTISCMKHFPGLASTPEDTGEGTVSSPRTMEDLRSTEFLPFRAGLEAGVDMVMISHVSYPEIVSDSRPGSLSPIIVTELLRNELGYSGVVITDSFAKGAIRNNYSDGEAAVLAIQAGCDMILMPEDLEASVEAVITAVRNGNIPESRLNESVLRILSLKAACGLLSE